jgi:hypothetical protein
MRGRLRKAGLTLVAALALGAAVAPLAKAGFQAESYPATISGTQIEGKHLFKTVANELFCGTYDFQGKLSEAAKEIALSASPSGCSTAGVLTMTVNMSGCTWNFNSGKGLFAESLQVVCPAGKEIVWTASSGNCTAKIPPQTIAAEITYTNTATEPKKSIKYSTSATGIHYTLGPSSGCLGSPAPGAYTNGTYTGMTTLTGENPETSKPVGIWVE